MEFGTATYVKEAGSISTLFIHRKVTYHMLFQYLQHSRELGHNYGINSNPQNREIGRSWVFASTKSEEIGRNREV